MEIGRKNIKEVWDSMPKEDNNMKQLIIASLISADNNLNDNQRIYNIKCLKELKAMLEDNSEDQRLYTVCCKGIGILERELTNK